MPEQITVHLPDGSTRQLPAGSTGADLAASIGRGLAKAAVAATVGGRETDLTAPLPDGATVAIITAETDEGRHVLRHSTAHVLAQAVTDLWPGARYAIGPPIENGFYYDFELPGGAHFSEGDLERIEARMRQIIAENQPFVREEHSVAEGLEMFADQPYKIEIIQGVDASESDEAEGVAGGAVSAYRNTDGFVDLCRGPHVPTTGRLGHFKLMKVAAAYWRGDEHRPQLQRIYGSAWESKAALEDHLHRLEEAEKRDHRRLGAELDLFHFPPELGGGLVVFHPRGGLIRKLMEDYSRSEHEQAGYEFVFTPHLAKSTLFEISGHLEWYAEGMYPPMELEGSVYYPKPMNCPMHILVYKSRQRSYRELPLRLFEFGTVYRFERSGVLNGLLRAFGLEEVEAELATRPDKFVGDPAEWDVATDALRRALEDAELPYVVADGEGAFYAPKIDVHVRDAIGRRWQVSTLQVDFQEPQRFDMEFVGSDNARHRPYMIHRALFGSIERFFGILIEHYAGALPTWLSPVQVSVLPVRSDHQPYAEEVAAQLRTAGARVEVLAADEQLGARVRRAKMDKVPYVLVVGDDDVAARTVGVNSRDKERPDRGVPLGDFVGRVATEIETHA